MFIKMYMFQKIVVSLVLWTLHKMSSDSFIIQSWFVEAGRWSLKIYTYYVHTIIQIYIKYVKRLDLYGDISLPWNYFHSKIYIFQLYTSSETFFVGSEFSDELNATTRNNDKMWFVIFEIGPYHHHPPHPRFKKKFGRAPVRRDRTRLGIRFDDITSAVCVQRVHKGVSVWNSDDRKQFTCKRVSANSTRSRRGGHSPKMTLKRGRHFSYTKYALRKQVLSFFSGGPLDREVRKFRDKPVEKLANRRPRPALNVAWLVVNVYKKQNGSNISSNVFFV